MFFPEPRVASDGEGTVGEYEDVREKGVSWGPRKVACQCVKSESLIGPRLCNSPASPFCSIALRAANSLISRLVAIIFRTDQCHCHYCRYCYRYRCHIDVEKVLHTWAWGAP